MFIPSEQNLKEVTMAKDCIFQFIGDYVGSEEWLDNNSPLTESIWNASTELLRAVNILQKRIE